MFRFRVKAALIGAVFVFTVVSGADASQHTVSPDGDADVSKEELKKKVVDLVFTVESLDGTLSEADTSSETAITVSADVLFAFDSYELSASAKTRLAEIAQQMRREAKGVPRVEGHTDDAGDAAYNQTLSERRAESVALFLRSEGAASSLESVGLGEGEPIADNKDEVGRAKNRRVTITFIRK